MCNLHFQLLFFICPMSILFCRYREAKHTFLPAGLRPFSWIIDKFITQKRKTDRIWYCTLYNVLILECHISSVALYLLLIWPVFVVKVLDLFGHFKAANAKSNTYWEISARDTLNGVRLQHLSRLSGHSGMTGE